MSNYIPITAHDFALARRLDELNINELEVIPLPNGYYQATDGKRYDGPGSPYRCIGDTPHEAVEQLIAEVEAQE